MAITEAIILAGGLGTRLQSMVPGIPKCMAPVRGKPFLSYVLDYLSSQEIQKVILSVGYQKEHVINYFGNKYHSMDIDYAIETELLGTGGAVKFALNQCSLDEVFIINGDTYFVPDLHAIKKRHSQTSSDITIAVKHQEDTGRYGLVIIDKDGRITDFKEKDPLAGSGWINGGIYLVNRNIFENQQQKIFSLENDIFRKSVADLTIHAFQTDAFFLDIGIPEDYESAQLLIPESV